jgi:separase
LIENIKESKNYIYMDHGAGDKYLSQNDIFQIKKCGVVILMGCSSALLNDYGEMDTYGTVFNYLLVDCQIVVGNLWEVTDGDIDRFSHEFLENINNSNDNIVMSLQKSRDSCVLNYLTGASPIIYGLPIFKK